MAGRGGTSTIIAGLLIIPIVLLAKALDFNGTEVYSPPVNVYQTLNAYEAHTYTEPKAPLNNENLKAAFPSFQDRRAEVAVVKKPSSDATLRNLRQFEAKDYVGKLGCAENGSCFGDLNAVGTPKEVHVQGYYRADGIYVRGHYRSRPSK